MVRVAPAPHRLREEGVAAHAACREDSKPRVRSLGDAAQLPRLEKGEDRQFRLDRIKQAQVLDPGFDPTPTAN
jgi:hypothetical protein